MKGVMSGMGMSSFCDRSGAGGGGSVIVKFVVKEMQEKKGVWTEKLRIGR